MTNISENKGLQVGSIKISDFTYNLPDGKIAGYPLAERDNSKLLVWENGKISQTTFKSISDILPEGSFLIFNNTKVIRARLKFTRDSGAAIEIFCLEPYSPSDYQLSFARVGSVLWRCLVGNAKKWKKGKLTCSVRIKEEELKLEAEIIQKEEGSFIIKFVWNSGHTFSEIIEHAGIIPIPPYLKRESEDLDKSRYQTIYAKIKGSVAAPTAGLHFTQSVIESLRKKGFKSDELTLHVGAGTFQPVKSEFISGHTMHSETVSVSLRFLKNLSQQNQKLLAVGTTSVRSLESLYWIGVQLKGRKKSEELLHISQWEPYGEEPKITAAEAINQIITYLEKQKLEELRFTTRLIIVPGYRFRLTDGMFTNFHQPQSTLLLLVGAFLGDDWRKVYNYALKNDFRFLSYGDSNLYIK